MARSIVESVRRTTRVREGGRFTFYVSEEFRRILPVQWHNLRAVALSDDTLVDYGTYLTLQEYNLLCTLTGTENVLNRATTELSPPDRKYFAQKSKGFICAGGPSNARLTPETTAKLLLIEAIDDGVKAKRC